MLLLLLLLKKMPGKLEKTGREESGLSAEFRWKVGGNGGKRG
jgi:hypothetical protein